MNQEFELIVDGEVRGTLTLMMTPVGIGVLAEGDVQFRAVEQPQRQEPAPQPMAIPDNYMRRLLGGRNG